MLSAAQIAPALERPLARIATARRAAAAEALAGLHGARQSLAVQSIAVVAKTSAELAFELAMAMPGAFENLDEDGVREWIAHALDIYDRSGLYAASDILKRPEVFGAGTRAAVAFEEAASVLTPFIRALGASALVLAPAALSFTDGERIYLPHRIDRGSTRHENFLRYKATAALLWAQNHYGTFEADFTEICADFDEPLRALELLNAIETVRLEACLTRELPGLGRELGTLRNAPVDSRLTRLREADATVHDSIELLRGLYGDPSPVEKPHLATLTIQRPRAAAPASTTEAKAPRKKTAAPSQFVQVIESSGADVIEVADDRLVAEEGSDTVDAAIPADDPKRGESSLYAYDEWDHERHDYRKRWCTLREIDVEPGDPAFCEAVRVKHARHIAQLRRVFECVREAPRTLRRQPDGDAIDFDALIEGVVDVRCGAEMPALLFTQRHHVERDLAALFLIDMSGSTRGWGNDAEREALVMLCEALDVLGDRYAIYGFSGLTRERCEIFRIKRFGEPFGDAVCARIAGMKPQDYTRMGAAIRHATMRLSRIDARTRLLVTLSDGKPDDYSDNYRGEYGIEDTRRALLEAHRAGLKPYCVTLDREARDYLPHMYGPASWSLVDDVTRLPFRLAEIYRRLTS